MMAAVVTATKVEGSDRWAIGTLIRTALEKEKEESNAWELAARPKSSNGEVMILVATCLDSQIGWLARKLGAFGSFGELMYRTTTGSVHYRLLGGQY